MAKQCENWVAMDEVEVNGHKYRAVEAPVPGRCGDCVFKNGFGCLLAEVKGDALSYCSGKHRPDGKHMNFVPAHHNYKDNEHAAGRTAQGHTG